MLPRAATRLAAQTIVYPRSGGVNWAKVEAFSPARQHAGAARMRVLQASLGSEDLGIGCHVGGKNCRGHSRYSDRRYCSQLLVGGEGFAVDASLVRVDGNRQRGVPGTEANGSDRASISRPLREYLAALAKVEKKTSKNISLTDPVSGALPGERRSTPIRRTI